MPAVTKNTAIDNIHDPAADKPLTAQQEAFCINYLDCANGYEAAIKAGYKDSNARPQATRLLNQANIKKKIHQLKEERYSATIMTGQEVMQMYTDIAQGKVKDQFGLEASLGDRLKALDALAKRTVDIENRVNGQPDTKIEIELKWD